MLPNYHIHPEYGVLTQIERMPFVYDEKYVAGYDALDCQKMSMLRYWKIVEKIGRPITSILDVGYGNAAFLKYAGSQGVQIFGYDVHNHNGLSESQRVPSVKEGFYDVITYFDALEHVEDIGKEIKELADHHYLVISVPCLRPDENASDWDRWFESWHHRKENEHLWHFTPLMLDIFIRMNGYSLIYMGNPEDEIRQTRERGRWNIMTAIFRKD